jgi:integrase
MGNICRPPSLGYGADGHSLAAARQICVAARSAVLQGISPAQEKQRAKRQSLSNDNFGAVGKRWFVEAQMAESTRSMRKSIYDRDILPAWKNRLLTEITPDDLRALCKKVKDRGAPATAIHVRDIVKQIYGLANANGAKVANPAEEVGPATIATFAPKDRALTPSEIRIAFSLVEQVPTLPTIRLGLKLILLTMVRKSELIDGVWDEVDFEHAVWSIPKERMKRK